MITEEQKQSLAKKDPRYAKLFGVATNKPVELFPVSLPLCDHIGVGTGCNLRRCDMGHGGTTGVKACRDCGLQCSDYEPQGEAAYLPALRSTWTRQFTGLIHDKHATNCSLMPWQGRLILAYRTGWVGSKIHIADIDPATFTATNNRTIQLPHPLASGGREDPRLFVYRNRLHVAFIGVRVKPDGKPVARQLFARLNDQWNAEVIWEPHYARSPEWEKNWQPFEHQGRLLAVYSMSPWIVLDITEPTTTTVTQEPGVEWPFGYCRGGAAPVKHGDEFYCFYHGTKHQTAGPTMYTVGVLTFDAVTLKPVRMTKEPILWPEMRSLPAGSLKGKWHAATVFPCGAYRDGEQWIISYGFHDHWSRASAFNADEIERRLCKIQ